VSAPRSTLVRGLRVARLAPLAPAPARAQAKHRLRFATSVPRGSAWAKIVADFADDVRRLTHGDVEVQIFWGSSAGGESQVGERMARGQLDGTLSGGLLCQHFMPSMRVLALPGLFQSRDEATYVVDDLRPTLEKEAEKSGYVLLGTAGLGPIVIFTRQPVTSLGELRKIPLWRWEGEEVGIQVGNEMGLRSVPLPLEAAAGAYEAGTVDGFFAVPAASLAFQWFAQVRYLVDLRTGYLMGCAMLTTRASDALPQEYRDAVRGAVARLAVRFDDVSRRQDAALLGGVFEKQGLEVTTVSPRFRAEFFEASRVARERLGDKIVPRELLARVLQLLVDYRAEHDAK
jgi:TRAP-type C4-dicarboxylate transport system substrate-binding protein